ncbi:MAG: hypothetical protein M3Z02_11905, partial [Actinomycetota bacterium]|nr:hypothetical protein [Actinomycetota bacterium]
PTAVADRSGAGLAAADGSSAGRPAGVSPGEAAEAKTYPDEADPSGQGGRHGAGQRVLTRLVAPVAPREAAAAGGLPQVRGAAKPVVAGVLAGVADESLPVVAPATDLAHRLP